MIVRMKPMVIILIVIGLPILPAREISGRCLAEPPAAQLDLLLLVVVVVCIVCILCTLYYYY